MYSKTLKSIYGGGTRIMLNEPPRGVTVTHARRLWPTPPTFPTAVGIEVEIEGATSTGLTDPALFRVVPDASLRDGIEFVSHPLSGHEITHALANLDTIFKANPRSVFSHRCSIHIHIDVQQMTYEQLLVFLGFYLTVEDIFFATFFPDRKGNNYCFPLVSTQLTQEALKRENLTRDTWKYAAVNLYHLRDFGTLEFRQHPGTKNVHELLAWIKTIHNIYDYACRTPLKDFLTVLNDLNTTSGYTEYIRSVIPDWQHPIEPDNIYDAVTAAKFFLNRKGTE